MQLTNVIRTFVLALCLVVPATAEPAKISGSCLGGPQRRTPESRAAVVITGSLRDQAFSKFGFDTGDFPNVSMPSFAQQKRILTQLFSDRSYSCELIVDPQGTFLSARVLASSGDISIDKKAVQFLMAIKSVRLRSLVLPANSSFKIIFPDLNAYSSSSQ
jgi:hypothetical protein